MVGETSIGGELSGGEITKPIGDLKIGDALKRVKKNWKTNKKYYNLYENRKGVVKSKC